MAPLVTHLVVGERVFPQLWRFGAQDYSPFLLGCLLVDVNHFSDVDRRRTHFTGGIDGGGVHARNGGCANFLSQLDTVLLRPWRALMVQEQAFVAGYLCHLAADKAWRSQIWGRLHAFGIGSMADLPVPGDVLMTAFSVLSSQKFLDFPAVVSALNDAVLPHVLAHVPYDALRTMWVAVRPSMANGRSPEAYFEMLRRKGRSGAEIEAVRREHDLHWEDAVTLAQDLEGIEPFICAGVRRSLDVIPRLWGA